MEKPRNSYVEKNADNYTPKWQRVVASVALGAIVFTNTDHSFGELYWRNNNTEINLFSFTEKDKGQNNLWVVLPGFGVKSGNGMASVLKNSLSPSGDISYAQYSDDGVDVELLASAIEDLVKDSDYKSISFYAHSMGGSIMLNLLEKLNNKIPVKNIILDCSPYSVYDAKDKLAHMAAGIPIPYEVLPLVSIKLLYEIYNNMGPHQNTSLNKLQQFLDGARISFDGSSPERSADQFQALSKTNPNEMANSVQKSTHVYYIMPDNPDNDETVDVQSAYLGWKQYLGGELTPITVYGGGHANPGERPGEYAEALSPIFVEPYVKIDLEKIGSSVPNPIQHFGL